MKRKSSGLMLSLISVVCSFSVAGVAQTAASAASTVATSAASAVPKVVNFSGTLVDLNNKPLNGITGVTFFLYKEAQGGAPLWMETQTVRPGRDGRYTVTLGSTTSNGLPADVFVSGEARWLGVQVQGQSEQSRVLLVAVPYALKSGDAETLGGLPASAFLLAGAQAAAAGNTTTTSKPTPAVLPPATVTGSGTADFVPLWTSSTALVNSVLFQSGSGSAAKIGIGSTTPAATLDVNGGATIRGLLNLPNAATATAAAGALSRPFGLVASTFNSGTAKASNQVFHWQAEPVNNNTTSPTATLNLLFGTAPAAVAETGLKINNKGQLIFAPGQTFPGTGPGTVSSVASGFGLTGGPITSSGTLAVNTSVIPQLAANNTFSGNQSISGNLSVSGTSSAGTLAGGNALISGNVGIGTNSTFQKVAITGTIGFTGGTGLQPPLLMNSDTCCNSGTRMIWAHSPSFPTWGVYYDDSADIMHWQRSVGSDAMSVALGSGNTYIQGNTSIGTTSTFQKVAITGTIGFTGGTGLQPPLLMNSDTCCTSGTRMIWAHSPSFTQWGIYYDDSTDIMHFQRAIGTDAMSINLGNGNVSVAGTLSKGAGSFKIDDPLDPAHKYLSHSFVESPDMMNIYNGVATLNEHGSALVTLPEYFEALNQDFRYQLTSIGKSQPNLYVAKEISGNRFRVSGGKPGGKISWQVTGIRHDAYANAHRIPGEELKPANEQGTYMHPELFEKPEVADAHLHAQPARGK